MALNYAINDSNLTTNLKIWCPLNAYSDGTGAVTRYDAHNDAVFTDNGTTPSTTGNYNRAANFQRANSESLSTTDTNTDITSDFSFGVWVKFSTITSGQLRPFFGKDGGATTRSFASWLYNNSGTHQLRMFISSTGSNGEEIIVTPSTGNFSTGTWYHIGGTWDASTSTAEFFVNGASVGTGTGTYTAIANTAASFYIGRFGNYSGDYTDAAQQDFCLYDAVKSDQTFVDLYNSGDGVTYGPDYDLGTGSFSNSHTKGTSLTYSHTVTGTNPVLLVGVMASTAGSITGVTYNGVSMTEVDTYADGINSLFFDQTLWVLASPATGSNTVSVQTTGTGTMYLYTKASSYIGVDQTTPAPHNNKNSTAGATTLTLSIDTSTSPSTDNCWISCISFANGNYTLSAGTGTRNRPANASIDNWLSFMDNYLPISPAGSDSLVANLSTSSQIQMIGVSLAPIVPATSSITSVDGVAQASITSFNGVANASIASINGVANS